MLERMTGTPAAVAGTAGNTATRTVKSQARLVPAWRWKTHGPGSRVDGGVTDARVVVVLGKPWHGRDMRGRVRLIRWMGGMLAAAALTTAVAKETSKPGQRPTHQGPLKVLRGFDANHNGRIDGPEVEKLREAFAGAMNPDLARYDLNGDGKLDDREVAAIRLGNTTTPPRTPAPGVADAPAK